MRLVLSHSSPINAVYSKEDGQALYKVHSSFKFKNRTCTISRILPDDIPSKSDVVERDRFAHLAQIDWKMTSPSVIRFGGSEVDVKTFFREEEFGKLGRNRVFTAPDGREYRWVLGWTASSLYLNDEAKTPVARFHPQWLGILKKGYKASLEIFPPGEHIVDAILVTFMYIEKLRKERERASRYNGGAVGMILVPVVFQWCLNLMRGPYATPVHGN